MNQLHPPASPLQTVISTEGFAPANAQRRDLQFASSPPCHLDRSLCAAKAQRRDPCIPSKSRRPQARAQLALTILGLFLILSATQAFAQGCTQCLDSTRATPPAVQAAYRHAIYLLGGFGVAVFAGGLLLLRRESRE